MAKSKKKKAAKVSEAVLAKRIEKAWSEGNYIITDHADLRGYQRGISEEDINQVFEGYLTEDTGFGRRISEDKWHDDSSDWTYAIYGMDIDDRPLIVSIGFDEENTVIVTVMEG